MDEEIDLRPYVAVLFYRWKWLIGISIIFALSAFGLSSLLSPTYQATALVAITSSRDVLQLDTRIREVDEQPPSRAYPELAVSDELLQNVLAQLDSITQDVETVSQLRGMLEARLGNDVQLLILTVTASDPQDSAAIANVWAEQFVDWANQIYGTQNSQQIPYFENQLSITQSELETAENALIDFQSRNQTETISNTLRFYTETQAKYLETLQTLHSILPDAQRLQTQLTTDGHVTEADQFISFLWRVKAFGLESDGVSVMPVTVQLNDISALTGQSQGDQNAFLDNLIMTLTAKSNEIEEQLVELEPRILELQRQLQMLEIEHNQLVRKWTLAEETYIVLTYKLTEERIITQEVSRGVLLASRASPPENSMGPSKILFTFMGGFLGFIFTVLSVWSFEWWHKE